MLVRNQGGFELIDYTSYVELVPRVYTFVDDMKIFEEKGIQTTVAQVERIQNISHGMTETTRGGSRGKQGTPNSKLHNFNVPYFADDWNVTAADVQNLRMFGTANAPRTVKDHVFRLMSQAKRNFQMTKETALINAILGKSYSPAGLSNEYNYFTEFGVTAATAPVDFTDVAVDPRSVMEQKARKHIQVAAQDGAREYQLIALCGTTWFESLINHPLVEQAYQYYDSLQEPLRGRVGGNSINRKFESKGILYVEIIDPTLDAGSAVVFPKGIPDHFEVVYSPIDDALYSNTIGKELYLQYKQNTFDRIYRLESETGILAINKRPELSVVSVGTFA